MYKHTIILMALQVDLFFLTKFHFSPFSLHITKKKKNKQLTKKKRIYNYHDYVLVLSIYLVRSRDFFYTIRFIFYEKKGGKR